MKYPSLIIFLLMTLMACSSDTEEVPEPEIENTAPEIPVLLNPEDELYCIDNDLEFSWSAATDPDNDNVFYTIEVSELSDFSNIYKRSEVSSPRFTIAVDKGKTYYWRVHSKDDKGNNSAYSQIRSFYTEDHETYNSLPSSPVLISPVENLVNAESVELSWSATDADGEALKFDLYFGVTEAPDLYRENLQDNYFEINNLEAGRIYYWKIIARDENGGSTIGQTWSFKTF